MSVVDLGFILAVMAFGWGLSLASYRRVARRYGWPMGAWQAEWPSLTSSLGILCILTATLYALARGYGGHVGSAMTIPVFGVAWAIFWTGFLRVGAQSALLLGPPAALLLIACWLG